MALRKDKIQALKDSLCLVNVDPATRSALNNLVDNLMDLFDDVALPEFGELPGIDTGEFGFPEGAPFNFPTGGGNPPFFDPLDGFGGQPPGGDGEFGPGDGGGDGGGGGGGVDCEDVAETVIAYAESTEEIPALSDGVPGEGNVFFIEIEVGGPDTVDCVNECKKAFDEDTKEATQELRRLKRLRHENDSSAAIDEARKRLRVIRRERKECLDLCGKGTPVKKEGEYTVQNISCESIEAGTGLIVGGTITREVCGKDFTGKEAHDLYVLVEACGCD